jgi:CheY-like chemotaxis protein
MSRILLADDSPHAQRMGERILREEGFEVVSLTDGNAAMLRLADVDPDLILADVFLPGKTGIELCRYVKSEPRFRHVRVVLTAGLLEPFDEEEAKRAGCDAILKKPFEALRVASTIEPLVKEAQFARHAMAERLASVPLARVVEPPAPEPMVLPAPQPASHAASDVASAEPPPQLLIEPPPSVPADPGEPEIKPAEPLSAAAPELDPERVRAAITIALDAAMPAMIQEITERVLIALGH